ncbi:MAG: DUF2087 domain-containing protein [Clostridia bacterium]|nr:DUF2087 domain-containing protein [Clostridia bacterium]
MDYGKLTIEEIRKGYHKESSAYVCDHCGQAFPEGQVFALDGCFYMAEQAAARHMEERHGGSARFLLRSPVKYNNLTDNQRELLAHFEAGLSDGEIAKKLGISPSTVRHQKFIFREKAKQAKHYLAVFGHVFEGAPENGESLVPIHNHATCCDDRYVITRQERDRILKTAFESLSPPLLRHFPAREKKKVAVLSVIAEQFAPGQKYSEKEVNQTLKPIYEDYVLIRRTLIDYGFMDRAKDGSTYWLRQG